jgi:MFS family permease
MTASLVGGLLILLRITRDRPPSAGPDVHSRRPRTGSRFGITIHDRSRFARLVLPGFLTSIGAGQVLPFLNLFIQRKFGLDLASLNVVFALTSLGTMLAVLFQPVIARRLGRLRSVVIVQGLSIPFLIVLGFSPLLWTVIAAMTVRNSLMNAGNPIFFAFALDQVAPAERATFSAVSALLWSAGWAIAGPWYSVLQANLGFDAGYAVNFATIIALYSLATALLWLWFRDAEARPGGRLLAAAVPGASA